MLKSTENQSRFYDDVLFSALANNTRIAYDKGWACFQDYCKDVGIDALAAAPDDVADFFIIMGSRANMINGKSLSFSTLSLYRSAINRKFVEAHKPSPTAHPKVDVIMKGLARMRGTAQRRVLALREHHILSMLEQCGDSPIGLRDAALISLGFSAALRRSEICALTVDDIQIISSANGAENRQMFINIRKSKTDQEGKGQRIAIPEGNVIRPIKRLEDWLHISAIRWGHIFQSMTRNGNVRGRPLHHADVPRLLKHYGKIIGLNPNEISGHSLRAGFVTSAAAHNARLDKIMQITRHTNPETVMGYIRDTELFRDHAGKDFL
ncbi:MAG: site-specific integrase [Gammaproteobacteria bacterium]|nr:site-specific integrase [Gammaproteobacteria bacterium]